MGKIFKFGKDVDTDQIIASQYLLFPTIDEMKIHTFESLNTEFYLPIATKFIDLVADVILKALNVLSVCAKVEDVDEFALIMKNICPNILTFHHFHLPLPKNQMRHGKRQEKGTELHQPAHRLRLQKGLRRRGNHARVPQRPD